MRALKAIGNMLNDLADLFKELGDQEGEKEIREKTKFTNKIAVSIKLGIKQDNINKYFQAAIQKFPDSSVEGLNCNNPGDFETTARMLEDLVKLIEEVGIDKLKNQLGIQGLF